MAFRNSFDISKFQENLSKHGLSDTVLGRSLLQAISRDISADTENEVVALKARLFLSHISQFTPTQLDNYKDKLQEKVFPPAAFEFCLKRNYPHSSVEKLSYKQLLLLANKTIQELLSPGRDSLPRLSFDVFTQLSPEHLTVLADSMGRFLPVDPDVAPNLSLEDFISLSPTQVTWIADAEAYEHLSRLAKKGDKTLKAYLDEYNNANCPPLIATMFGQALTEAELLNNSPEKNYQKILEMREDIPHYFKVAAFFILYKKICSEVDLRDFAFPSAKINKLFQLVEPLGLRRYLQGILQKMSGCLAMANEEPITVGVEVEYSGVPREYMHLLEATMSAIQTGWHHPGDITVMPSNRETYAGESTTPIISNNQELREAMLNVAFLQAMGANTNASCGIHVHIGVINLPLPADLRIELPAETRRNLLQDLKNSEVKAQGEEKMDEAVAAYYKLEFMKQFLLVYKSAEERFHQVERPHSFYLKKILPTLDAVTIRRIEEARTPSELMDLVNPGERNYEVNLRAFFVHGTLEVRRFAGTTKEAEIYSMVAMVEALAQEAQAKTKALFQQRPHLASYRAAKIDQTQQKTVHARYSDPQTVAKTDLFILRGLAKKEGKGVLSTAAVLDEVLKVKAKQKTPSVPQEEKPAPSSQNQTTQTTTASESLPPTASARDLPKPGQK